MPKAQPPIVLKDDSQVVKDLEARVISLLEEAKKAIETDNVGAANMLLTTAFQFREIRGHNSDLDKVYSSVFNSYLVKFPPVFYKNE